VDVSEIPPRPRLYGAKHPEIVKEAWQEVEKENVE
jgi:hypothetical protein